MKEISTLETLIDKGISIALLGVGVVVLFKLFKDSQQQNKARDKDYELLLERTVKALENSNNAIESLTKKLNK